MLSFPLASRRAIGWDLRIYAIDSGEPINLKVHSGGMTPAMCVKSAGRWGRGRVSTRKASFVGSQGDGGEGHNGHWATVPSVPEVQVRWKLLEGL
jgi:hypothetical protein